MTYQTKIVYNLKAKYNFGMEIEPVRGEEQRKDAEYPVCGYAGQAETKTTPQIVNLDFDFNGGTICPPKQSISAL